MKVKSQIDLLYKAMARSLNIGENSFSDQFGEQESMRAVLLQDKEEEGLQVLINDKWTRVPIVADALLVNLGDQMQIMSNGIFKSPGHGEVTNSERFEDLCCLIQRNRPRKGDWTCGSLGG